MSKFEKVMKVINKYVLLVGGISSFINALAFSNTTFEMLGWACGAMYALSGFAQIVELEKKLKDNEDDIPG
jgi:hypothetical protein